MSTRTALALQQAVQVRSSFKVLFTSGGLLNFHFWAIKTVFCAMYCLIILSNSVDGYIRIWSFEALVQNQLVGDMRQLANVRFDPPSPIKCVRWSPNGMYLAAGAENGHVSLWHLLPGTKETFGGQPNYENWEPYCSPFRAHSMGASSVLDLHLLFD